MNTLSLARNALAAVVLACLAHAAPAAAFEPHNPECIAPSNAGSGWDFTCREVGRTMQDLGLVKGTVQVTDMAGGGGADAFAEVVSNRNDDNNLIVAASAATATRLAQGAYRGNTMQQVRWVASIGADYGVIAVAGSSPIKTLPELFDRIRKDPGSISIAGGSAVGGWDHLKVLLVAKKAGITDLRKIRYVAFKGADAAITQLLAGSVQAFSGDASQTRGFVESGDIRVIAVLSPQRLGGVYKDVPTARQQGIDVIGANWRGFYAPGGMSDDAYKFWVEAVDKVYASDEWKKIMKQNDLAPLDLSGADFQTFVANSVASIQALSHEIGLIK